MSIKPLPITVNIVTPYGLTTATMTLAINEPDYPRPDITSMSTEEIVDELRRRAKENDY